MRSYFFILLICCISCNSSAADLQYFNSDVLGKPADKSIRLFNEIKSNDVQPTNVMVDIEDGIIIAASIKYQHITFENAKISLNKLYKKYEINSFKNNSDMGLWRNEDGKYSIQLIKDKDIITITYIKFQPNKKVFENIIKSESVNK